MKKIFLIVVLFNAGAVFGQQDPFLSGDNLGPIWHNPASFGTVNTFSVNTIGQVVWPNLPVHSSSVFINSEYKFGYKKQARSLENPVVISGAGFNVLFDQYPAFDKLLVTANYNLQVKISSGSRLSFGISPGIQYLRFDTALWIPPTNIPDPNLSTDLSQVGFTMGAGLCTIGSKVM